GQDAEQQVAVGGRAGRDGGHGKSSPNRGAGERIGTGSPAILTAPPASARGRPGNQETAHRAASHIKASWGGVVAAIGGAFVAFLIIHFFGGGAPPDLAGQPRPPTPLPNAPTPAPAGRPETVKDPRDAQWEAYARYRQSEAARYAGAGVPGYR